MLTLIGLPSFSHAVAKVMDKWIRPRCSHVCILVEISAAVEQATRVPPFMAAMTKIVRRGIDRGLANVRISFEVPVPVEKLGGQDQPHVRPSTKGAANSQSQAKSSCTCHELESLPAIP